MKFARTIVGLNIFCLVCWASQGCGDKVDDLDRFYQELQNNAPLHVNMEDWRWQEIVNSEPHPAVDGFYYGTAFFARAGFTQNRESYNQATAELLDYISSYLQQADDDTLYYIDHLVRVGSAIFGTLEYIDQSGDKTRLDLIHRLVDTANSFMQGFGYYYDWAKSSPVQGPTATSVTSILMNLKLLPLLDQAQQSEHLSYIENVMAAIEANAHHGSYYLLRPSDENLYFYPNIEMGLAFASLYQATGKSEHLQSAQQLLEVVSVFRDPIKGSYTDPEEYAGFKVQTNDFASLAAQNYMISFQMGMFELTQDKRHLREAENVLNFIRLYLYDPSEKKILHHWIDGRKAEPADYVFFCGGCSLQTLYNLWILKEHLKQ